MGLELVRLGVTVDERVADVVGNDQR